MRYVLIAVRACVCAAAVAGGACKKAHHFADAGAPDAMPRDGGVQIDAPIAMPGPTGFDVTTSGGTLQGPTYRMDVEIGHPNAQGSAAGDQHQLRGGAPVLP